MKTLSKSKQKIIAYAIILSLQLQSFSCYAAAVTPDTSAGANTPVVTDQSGVPIVDIVKPNENGLSHNKFTDFNVGTPGLIFNNNAGNTAVTSQLAGQINPNANLGGQTANIILSEITGNNISALNGMMEVGGNRASIIIANPNGIVGNGFGFINTNRASLVTGTPNIVNGNIDSFTITGGKITIEGTGNTPLIDDSTGTYVNQPVSKLDIMTRAAVINADLWAQDEINVVTGANTVKYATLTATPIGNPSADNKPNLALDISALGGMYAGKIQLVGTEKGLGYNIQGDIYANNNFAITNDGKITFIQKNKQYTNEDGEAYTAATSITSDGSINVTSTDAIENKGQLIARKDITISAEGALTNQGTVQAGASYEENEDDPNSAVISQEADLKITSGGKITNTGMIAASKNVTISGQDTFANSGQVNAASDLNITAVGTVNNTGALAAGGNVTLKGEKVKYSPLGVTGATINVTQTNPDSEPENPDPDPGTGPGTDPKPEEKDTETIINTIKPDIPDIPDLPNVAGSSSPAATVQVAKDDNLRLTADVNAAGTYQPIIDKAANGVDLVQIAQVNANGVSRNLYTDFNIKSTGLILNNSSKYVKTELGGYIDRNMNIAGNGANVILNEITSSKGSVLNGYLEVAGNKASVVIANANGISVNGLGFINTTNAVLSTGKVNQWENGNITFGVPQGDFFIQGDGLNAKTPGNLNIITNNFKVDKSELWANELTISANGTLKNTGKISADENVTAQADRLDNSENGYIEAAQNIAVTVNKDVTQDTATLQAGGNITITGQKLQNKNNSMINGKGNVDIVVDENVDNTKSIINTGKNLTVAAANLSNTDTALVSYAQNGQFDIQHKVTNNNAAIKGNGSTVIRTTDMENTNNAVLNTDKDVSITAANSMLNDHATVYSGNTVQIAANTVTNKNNGYIYAANNLTVDAHTSLQNQKATLKAGAAADFTTATFTNENSGYVASGKAMDITAADLTNDGASIKSQDTLTVKGDTLTNKNSGLIYSQNDGTYDITKDVQNTQSALETSSNLVITADSVTNDNKALLASGKAMDITAANAIVNAKAAITSNDNLAIKGSKVDNTANSVIASQKDISIAVTDKLNNNASTIDAKGKMNVAAESLDNQGYAAMKAGKDFKAHITTAIVQDHSIVTAGADADIEAASLKNTSDASLAADGNLTLKTSGDILNDDSTIGAGKAGTIHGNNITNQNKGAIFITGAMDITAGNALTNKTGLIAGGSTASITAQTINNTKNSVVYAGGDITLNAAGTVLNQSSDIESQGNIKVKANDLINEKEIFETAWIVNNELISYKIPYSQMGGDYYDGVRSFNRNIHTGSITKETADSHILANGNIDIEGNVANHYSTISAGKDLTITGNKIENWGYQGTIHHDDLGDNTYYWKYKKHRKFHIHCSWKYGTTVEPYEDHQVYEQETERLSVLGANGKVTLHAATIDNKTFEAGGEVITFKTKDNTSAVKDKLSGNTVVNLAGKTADKITPAVTTTGNTELDISALKINTLIFTINNDVSAKYLIETNEKFANYHNFLSSDYLLNRVKADPEKVAKRLGDGYYEQKLVTEQLTNLTGKRFLDGYSSDMEQYKALMENGAVAAEEMGLSIGVALTAAQLASLTSDIVWLVEENVNGQKVLVPEVYLATVKAEDLSASGALIVGGDIELYAKQDITNIGTIKADKALAADAENITNLYGKIQGNDTDLTAKDTVKNISGEISGQNNVSLKAKDIVNQTETKETQYRELHQTVVGGTASITAGSGSLKLEAGNDITNAGAVLSAGKDVTLHAGNNIDIVTVAAEKHVAVTYPQSSLAIDNVTHQQSVIGGTNITMNAGSDVNLSGALTSANENTTITAGNNVNITAVKNLDSLDSSVGRKGGSYFTHDKSVDETVVGSQVTGTQSITVNAGQDINVKGSDVNSEKGKAALTGENVNISGETEYHEQLHEEHREKVGFLSSTKTDIYDRQTLDAVIGSNISADSINITTNKDINVSGSSVVADNDVNLKAKGNVNIVSQEEVSSSDYEKQVKKSGLLTGGGFGVTIGKEKQKDTYANQTIEQAGSTVGSVSGNVKIESGKDVKIEASDLIAGKDINVTGENVTIESKDNTYNAQEKHEYEKSGLTVSLGGATINAINKVAAPLERATQVQDERLAALYGYKAYDELTDKENKKALDGIKDPKNNISINVSLGTQKSESKAQSSTTLAQESNIKAQGDITIYATKEDINIKGSNIEGENVSLQAKGDVNITASENANTSDQTSKSSSGSIGVSISPTGISGINAGYNKGKGEIKENSTTYNPSSVTAKDTLTIESGNDTNIIGSKVSGDTVKADIGGNLNIESLQNKETYDEKNSSSGMSISVDLPQGGKTTGSKTGIQGSASKGKIESDYESVINQAGIYAGEGGFDIHVVKNTDLKGAVIASDATPDKNKLSTDTLTYSDIQNQAEYSASSVGVNLNTGKDAEKKDAGLTPNIGVKASGDADSTTKSAISPGTVEVRSNPDQDLSKLSRDPEGALNALGKIFDKKTVQEQQELAGLFGELAFEEVHKISKANGWDEGSPQKIALHAFVGAVMADLGGGNALSGAVGAGLNEAVQKELKEIFKDDPDMHQWASAIIGAAAAAVVGGDVQTGGSTAASGTKNNALYDYEIKKFKENLQEAIDKGAGEDELKELVIQYWSDSRGNASGSTAFYHFNEFTDMEGGTVGQDFKDFLKMNFAYDWNAAFAANGYDVNATWANLLDHMSSSSTVSYARSVNGVSQETVTEYEKKKTLNDVYTGLIAGLGGTGAGRVTQGPNWKGSGPTPGVIGINSSTESVGAMKNYYPSGGSIEFVFDPKTNTFVVGAPKGGAFTGSPHQQLAQTIEANESSVVGGMFSRGPNGEIITNESSGHFWQNWTPETRQQFLNFMESHGLQVMHSEGM